MSKEHYWPRWLTKRASIKRDGVQWLDGKWISPNSATVPICADCNHAFGAELEQPVSTAFEEMEAGKGLTDAQAELLIRWLWKFEGLAWMSQNILRQEMKYSDRWTLRERILGPSLNQIRHRFVLAISFFEKNDDGFTDLPVGLDSEIGELNAIFVSGVFSRTALMVSLVDYAGLLPSQLGVYSLKAVTDTSSEKVFFPPTGFKTAADAINVMRYASRPLSRAHESHASRPAPRLILPSRRVELP